MFAAPAQLVVRRRLAARVALDAYYTDGADLYVPTSIGATGCVTVVNQSTLTDRCLSIEDFRARFWRVK